MNKRLYSFPQGVKNFNSLEECVADWKKTFGKGGQLSDKRDTIEAMCKKAKSFKHAVEIACHSRRPNGKMHHHQSKVKEVDRKAFAKAIIASGANKLKTFDELHDLLEQIGLETPGIGPVTIYDVAVRIAAYQGLNVLSLYFHAGVRIGWAKLHGHRSPNVPRIARKDLPKALLILDTNSIEDFLCGYKASFKPWLKKEEVI